MKKRNMRTSLLALLLAAAMFIGIVPAPAAAATSKELKEQISELKKEKEAMQAEIREIRGQYQAKNKGHSERLYFGGLQNHCIL